MALLEMLQTEEMAFVNTTEVAYNTYKLQELIPLGEKYNAAPSHVQEQVDALLNPYSV